MASQGYSRILRHLESHETLYTSSVVALAINLSREAVNDARKRGELEYVTCPRGELIDKFYEAEAVARYLGKPVSEVRRSLNMARLVAIVKEPSGVGNHQCTADKAYDRLRLAQD